MPMILWSREKTYVLTNARRVAVPRACCACVVAVRTSGNRCSFALPPAAGCRRSRAATCSAYLLGQPAVEICARLSTVSRPFIL